MDCRWLMDERTMGWEEEQGGGEGRRRREEGGFKIVVEVGKIIYMEVYLDTL